MSRRIIGNLCLLAAVALTAAASHAGQYESDDYTVNVSQIAGTGLLSQAFYAPSVVRSLDNQYVLLYFMGTHDINPDTVSDSVYVYRAPNTWSGFNNAFSPHPSAPAQNSDCTFGCPGRILPNTNSGNTNSLTNSAVQAFGDPSVWRDELFTTTNRKIRLLAVRSPSPNDKRDIIYGVSADGIAFSWQGLIKTHPDINYDIVWRDLQIGTTAYWYGFIGFSIPGGARGVGAIRAVLNTSAYASALPITGIQVYTNSGWQSLPASTVAGFLWEFPADLSRHPKDLWSGVRHPSFHYHEQTGTWEIYGARPSAQAPQSCSPSCSTPAPGINELVYKVLDISLAATPDTMFSAAATQVIEAESPGSPRCMPGSQGGSRSYPALLEWVLNNKPLYSASNDPTPQRTACPAMAFPGQSIVRTFLKSR